MPEITDELRQRHADALRSYDDAQAKAKAAVAALHAFMCEAAGIAVGDRVRTKKGEFIVTNVDQMIIRDRLGDKPWLKARKILKDGSEAKAITQLYRDWEKVE